MIWVLFLRWAHVIGACVLLGTGAGIAFFMFMAHRTGKPLIIAHTARIVVIADFVFTASAVIVQPITGALLAQALGWDILHTGWIERSLALYVLTGALWAPVVFMQHRMWRLSEEAVKADAPLPASYYRLYRWWFACGVPAFLAVLAIIWLMLAKPAFTL